MLKDSLLRYGSVTRGLHWLMAISIFALFGFGLWMRDLDYYHTCYHYCPHIHKSVGVLVFFAWVLRVIWRSFNKTPYYKELPTWEIIASKLVHLLLYLLMLLMMVSGYFISTADGRPIEVFNWFEIPAVIKKDGLADLAGRIHETTAYVLIGFACFHAVAALKHYFINKDRVLSAMLPIKPRT